MNNVVHTGYHDFLEMVGKVSILSLAQVGGGQSLKILGGDPEMVRAAKMALDEHFRPGGSGPPEVVPPANLNTSACSDAVCQTETGKVQKATVSFNLCF